MATATAIHNIGKIVQVIGPVIDVEFEAEHLPEIYNALEVTGTADDGTPIRVIVEVQQHIGRNQVRAVAMSSTDAVVRGMEVVDTGGPTERMRDAFGGTPLYMAPEQVRGQLTRIGPATDIYAIAQVALTLLTGETYWSATTADDVMREIESGVPSKPSLRWPWLTESFDHEPPAATHTTVGLS